MTPAFSPTTRTRLTMAAAAYAVLVFLVLPIVLVVPMSFGEKPFLEFPPTGLTLRWYNEYLESPDWWRATAHSFSVAIMTSLTATAIGTAAAMAMVRGAPVARGLVRGLVVAPVIIPTIITAVSVFFLFAQLRMLGTTAAFVIGHTVLAVPYVVLTVSAALGRVDAELDLAAMVLGASRTRAFRHVTLPLIAPGVLSGAVFAFIISFDEAIVSLFLSGVHDKTLPRLMFENIEMRLTPTIAAVSTLLIAMSAALLGLTLLLARLLSAAPSQR